MANTCARFDFRAHIKELSLLKWCIYKYPHHVYKRSRHPTAVVWLIISWNTVLVAWLLSSSVANYIAWPLPAWCITPLLRLAPLWPLTPALQPPFFIVRLFKKFISNPARSATFSCTPYLSRPWNMAACKKEVAKSKSAQPTTTVLLNKLCKTWIFTTCLTAPLSVAKNVNLQTNRNACEHIMKQVYIQVMRRSSFCTCFNK